MYKSSKKDWAKELDDEQLLLIKKGIQNIEKNNGISHEEARKRIEIYIKNKTH